jgi:hypothetical protein
MAFEIELEDGTVLELEDGEDPNAAERDYVRQRGIAALKAKDPGQYDPESVEWKRANSAAEQEKTLVGIADPKTGIDLSRLPMDQRERFFKESAKNTSVVGKSGKFLKDLSPEEQAQFWSDIDKSSSPKMNLENTRAGIGSGMVRGWKGLTNLVLPDSLTPEFASDENIQEMDKRDEDLPMIPKLVGGAAATAPLSMGTGALLSTASKAAPAASILTRTLASPFTRSAVEGATQGAIYADPDEQGKGALIGGALGPALTGLGKAGGRLLRGTVAKSEPAKALEQLAAQHGEEIFLPISQAASDEGIFGRLMKSFYKEALPIVPGVKGKLERQGANAAEKLREIALREGLPSGGQLPANAGKKVSEAVGHIQRQFDDAYDSTVKSYAFNVPKDVDVGLANKIKALADPKTTVNSETVGKVTSELKSLLTKFSNGKTAIDGQNLLNVKREISDLMGMAKGHEKVAYKAADEFVDDIIINDLKQGGSKQNLADLKQYLELTPAFRAFTPVKAAAGKATDEEGRFLFRTLAKSAKNSPEQRAIGQIGKATVDQRAAAASPVGRILSTVATLGTAPSLYMAPTTTAAVIGGANLLATKGVQKTLLGDTKLQRRIVDLLRRHPKTAKGAGSLVRGAAVQTAAGE